MTSPVIAVLGAGSWGTAVAIHLASTGNRVLLWGRNPQQMAEMHATRCNARYLPTVTLPKSLTPTADLNHCIEHAHQLIIAVPSHAFAELLNQLPKPKQGLSWLTKGLDPARHEILSALVFEKWGATFPVAVISGPSFAREVAQNLPTALVLAGNNSTYLQSMHALLHQHWCRVYESTDLIGVQWCGAVKNIIAIACGVSDGLQYGANARAALITRGLSEMSRMGQHIGGRPETFMGLSGVGDLVLTCTDDQSRNRRFGLYVGRGETPQDAEQQIGQVVEGKYNAAQICGLAQQAHIEMPICQHVHALIEGRLSPKNAVMQLMNRPPKEE